MRIDDIAVNEVAMNPSTFANAIKTGDDAGVLVGFEFEVGVPKEIVSVEYSAEDKLVELFRNFISFSQLYFDDDHDNYIRPSLMDKFLKIKPEFNPAYKTFKAATGSEALSYRKSYSELIETMFDYEVNYSKVEDDLRKYFIISNADRFLKILDSFGYRTSLRPRFGYKKAAAEIKTHLEQTMNAEVSIFNEYHQSPKSLKKWYIEPDTSLRPNEGDTALEIVSPPMKANGAIDTLKKFYGMAKNLGLYTSKKNATGLHINVSIPKTLDVFKLAVFLGDEHVLKSFGRENNEYAVSVINRLRQQEETPYKIKTNKSKKNPKRNTVINYKQLEQIVSDITDDHFASISDNDKYVSFRHAGGNYLEDYQGVLDIVGRFVNAMIIASDPNMYKQEYLKKLTKIFGSPYATKDSVELPMRELLGIIRHIMKNGLPITEMQFCDPDMKRDIPFCKNRIEYVSRVYNMINYYLDMPNAAYIPNSKSAKANMIAKFKAVGRSSTYIEEFIARLKKTPQANFTNVVVFPKADINVIKNVLDKKISIDPIKEFFWVGDEDEAVTSTVNVLPYSNPLVKNYIKLLKQSIMSQSQNNLTESEEKPIFYFAYGMLTDPVIMEGISLVGKAELRNFEYTLYQFANVEPATGSTVTGCLWQIDRRILSQLDNLEGFPTLYDRRTYPVYCDGNKYVAEVYVMTPSTLERVQGTFPSRTYIESVLAGYTHAGIPLDQLYDAIWVAQENQKYDADDEYSV